MLRLGSAPSTLQSIHSGPGSNRHSSVLSAEHSELIMDFKNVAADPLATEVPRLTLAPFVIETDVETPVVSLTL